MSKRVVIFDSNPLVMAGLDYFLKKNGFDIAAKTSRAEALFHAIILEQPEFIIIDPVLMNEEYLTRLGEIKRIYQDLKVIIFSGSDSVFHILKRHRLNWMAYLSKNQPLEILLDVLLHPAPNNLTLIETTGHSTTALTFEHEITHLTYREIQVLREIGAGKTNKTIADEMHLSNKTISTYKRSIMNKLNTRDVRDVMDFARRHGF